MVCFRAARNKVDCRWETMFSPLELQNALRGLRQAAGLMVVSEAWDWERRARHEEAGELKLYKQFCLRSLRQIFDLCLSEPEAKIRLMEFVID